MRVGIIVLILGLAAGTMIVAGEDTSYRVATTITEVKDLDKLIATSFGGGHYLRVDQSDFLVVDLQKTSGPLTTEFFVFESSGVSLKLRAYLPLKYSVERKAEYRGGRLVISERAQGEEEWTPVVHVCQ